MTKPAIITIEQGKRFARVAKAEGVAVRVEKDGFTVTIFPDFHRPRADNKVEEVEDIIL